MKSFEDPLNGKEGTRDPIEEEREPKIISLNGENWAYIKKREFHGSVFRSSDGSKYLRIGNVDDINTEFTFVRRLYQGGFPVPEALEQGEILGSGYYIERSIGDVPLSDKFRDEYALQGKVGSDTFEAFCNTMCQFLSAQLEPRNHIAAQSGLQKNIGLVRVLEENPDMDTELIESCVKKAESRLRSLPKSLAHGDLSPRNTLEKGVIDFEFGFVAPVGYDVFTALLVERFWNFPGGDGKLQHEFDLSDEQISYYFKKVGAIADRYGVGECATLIDEFILFKSIWSLANEKQTSIQSGSTTKLSFRKKILKYCMENYLRGEQINTNEFKKLHTNY
ncbi:MAG: hypothetical protein UW92_C0015G0004 [Candidatus Jorgensenbacteria bacterium GW2011_GWA2_45_13]|uniref:Aminoglycoside phosphotransferase domain-containing protein n=1 Tax=Candidatus Jorgensenbacteria bacterium GW2011_GWA2_45_13 TaxID=1618662 RepID=A0A0G1P4B9_9BACT|nr:MAG: hypothetical protein UW92_C0015G0004 [Candidatus Jorgensenbacteria bacterium GW2011_GWA2_45_13]